MFSLDMGLLWTYLACMLGALVATALSVGLIAWYAGARKMRAGGGAEAVQAGEPGAGKDEIGRESRRHIPQGA